MNDTSVERIAVRSESVTVHAAAVDDGAHQLLHALFDDAASDLICHELELRRIDVDADRPRDRRARQTSKRTPRRRIPNRKY